jgi:hypothetical protein
VIRDNEPRRAREGSVSCRRSFCVLDWSGIPDCLKPIELGNVSDLVELDAAVAAGDCAFVSVRATDGVCTKVAVRVFAFVAVRGFAGDAV